MVCLRALYCLSHKRFNKEPQEVLLLAFGGSKRGVFQQQASGEQIYVTFMCQQGSALAM